MKQKGERFTLHNSDVGGIIQVANIKGGVGKSTIATNLAATLSQSAPTLIIDFDVQANASHALGFNKSTSEKSSYQLLTQKFSKYKKKSNKTTSGFFINFLRKIETSLFSKFIGHGDIKAIPSKVSENLSIIPAHDKLFGHTGFAYRQNLSTNLRLLKEHYTYIVLDTPSIWNKLIKMLYIQSSMSLIPVTLNALSTKSLQEYLHYIRRLTKHHRSVTIRVVKNEVYGSRDSVERGKTRTMAENRRFLESLYENGVYSGERTVSIIPETVMFSLEIPDSSLIRNAQDEGIPLAEFNKKSKAQHAFLDLADMVKVTVNNRNVNRTPVSFKILERALFSLIILATITITFWSESVVNISPPQAVTPAQVEMSGSELISHTFLSGENLARISKYAISYYSAIVPTNSQIDKYMRETVRIHNSSATKSEKIKSVFAIPAGMKIKLYPPSFIKSEESKKLVPVYRFFMKIVDDSCSYVTGDWCERGYGNETAHYGFDVAGALGSPIITPVSGVVINKNSAAGGKMSGVVSGGTILFYAHMDKRWFDSGDSIKVGESIGTVGMTGRTNGPHAHIGFGIRAVSGSGIVFGKHNYRVTDPKLFYYRYLFQQEI
jgi:cellulose biosynthesis protein BcsQ